MGILRQRADKERDIVIRRHRIAVMAHELNGKVRTAAVAPETLLIAVGVGVVIEQTGRRRVSTLASTLNSLNVYGTAVLALWALKKAG